MWDYTDKVKDHYLHPRNVGEITKPDGMGEVGSLSCGDALRLTFKLSEDKRIEDIKFKTFGCGSAIASASILTEMVKGKTIDEIEHITNQDIANALGGLPDQKMHCSVMGKEALDAAIAYFKSGGKTTQPPQKESPVVCTCFNITEREIEQAITGNHLKTVEEVTNFTKAGGGCGGCVGEIQKILDRINGAVLVDAAPARMTSLQKIDKIRKVLAEDVAPILELDGGSCELVDVDGNNVYVALKGHCAGCAFSGQTLQGVVEKKLREKVLPDLTVMAA